MRQKNCRKWIKTHLVVWVLEQCNQWTETGCLNQFDFVLGIDGDVGKSTGGLAHNFLVGTAK